MLFHIMFIQAERGKPDRETAGGRGGERERERERDRERVRERDREREHTIGMRGMTNAGYRV